MLSRQYWLYDLPLYDVKEHVVRMNAFLLLMTRFHTSVQIINEW